MPPEGDELQSIKCNIDRLSNISKLEFTKRYRLKKPVILSDISENIYLDWSRERLLEDFGDSIVGSNYDMSLQKYNHIAVNVTLRDFIKSMEEDSRVPKDYIFDRGGLFEAVPQLRDEYTKPFLFKYMKAPLVFALGTHGSGLPFHFHTEGFFEVQFLCVALTLSYLILLTRSNCSLAYFR